SARHIALSHFLLCKLFSAVSDRVREAFSYSDTVLLEIDLHNQETVKRLIRCKNLRRKQTTASYLHPKLHKRVENCRESFFVDFFPFIFFLTSCSLYPFRRNWDRKRPEWLLFILYQLCENLLDRPTSPMLDVFLANKAYEEEKQIRAIETTHEQCNPIVSLTQDEIIFAINYTISYLEHLHVTQRLFHINTERSVSALIERQLRDDIIVKRNERMANRLNQLLTDNPHLTVFSAIGTGHFFGNVSVLHHLKRMGYIVRSVGENDVMYV
uniref:Metalloprotease TIKI homolog n=1 Tax=Angiostrongylus cantonensis TaxID=6313 RepID=A0A0K0D7A9_ANGCA